MKSINSIEAIVKEYEAKVKLMKSQLKSHLNDYPMNEYAQDLLKMKESSGSSGPKNPVEFIIQTTIEKVQPKILSQLRKEIR